MVVVAIAGSSSEVAREIVDALVATGRHELVLLSRKDISDTLALDRTKWRKVDYNDVNNLERALGGVHTVLSFITSQTDNDNKAQKNLIDASLLAGVKRFAPSEWATSKFDHMPWYSGKGEIREYLKKINKNGKMLEYSLFQPGLFLNYFTHPFESAKHIHTFQTQVDFENRQAIVSENFENDRITLTTAQDLAAIVAKAIDYKDEWPVNGGVCGCDLTIAELVRLGEEIRGGGFKIEKLRLRDLKSSDVKSSWLPKLDHPAFTPEQAREMAGMFLAGMTLGISAGNLTVSDEWNRIFPEYQFTQPRSFLENAWKGKS